MNAPIDVGIGAEARSGQAGWNARLTLGFERRGERTVLAQRRHQGPLRVQKALYPEGEDVCQVILVHPPAGIAGGDDLQIDVTVGDGAKAQITTPGAGKWYRSAGRLATLTQRVVVEAGGMCEWVPQESIVFDGALGSMLTEVDLAPDAVYLGMETICLGRTGSGERLTRGSLRMETRLRRAGKTLWLERGRIDGGSGLMHSPAGLDGATVTGTLLAVGPPLDADGLARCRAIETESGQGTVTCLPGVLVARYLGASSESARRWLLALWQALRPMMAGRPGIVPRIWNT
ncbi:MAG: urease accessory protein UreD [Zoogloeaceae bacterium]|nr:urease accessory protein UreD [Zoogloeaceae bacterium]